MYLTICSLILVTLFFWYIIKPMFYWKALGVAYQSPWPILGNMAPIVFRQRSRFEETINFYKAFPTKRYNGIFQFTKPVLLVRDLDLIKQITIKDFDYFMDHNVIFSEDNPLMSKGLFSLKGQTWRNMRATLSPTFTSSKMRFMFSLMVECAETFITEIEKRASAIYAAEIRDLFTRFANDVIASVIFGYKCDSLAEPENNFYLMGKEATSIVYSRKELIKFLLVGSNNSLSKFLSFSQSSEKVVTYFRNLVKENIEKREKLGIVRPDMIQLLLEARSGRSNLTDNVTKPSEEGFAVVQEYDDKNAEVLNDAFLTSEDIAAQIFVFFFTGLVSVAGLLCLMCYELALNIEAQAKLLSEIDATLEKCKGKITYTELLNMKYLDMVISEIMRKWSPSVHLDRICVKDYKINPINANEKPLVVKKGTSILIPTAGIQRDPKYFPNPEKFDPERFSEENKQNIPAISYLPFGTGPRNCIASRFVLMEAKTLMFHLLSKFTITVVDKTPVPFVISKTGFSLLPKDGIWLGFKKRVV